MQNRPFFSIIVPTYNQAQFLGAALDSIIAQSDSDWEAIVVNDGSSDATPDVMEAYALRDPRIRTIHKSNGGVASALNEGRKQARGQWICWLSSDDMFDPHKLEIHRQWIERYPDCRFFFTYFRLLRDSTGEITDHDLWGPLPEREFQIIVLFYRNYISGISICIHREAWDQVGLMDESLRYGQDFDMWLRLLAVYPARFIPEWTCTNRNHALQGSEVFPQACYYDTAKGAIRFLNEHRFEEFFPLLDLSDESTALRALQKTLEVVAEPSAFVYSLGPHPALLFRILEWIWDTSRHPSFQQKLERAFRRWISQVLRQQNGASFNLFWKAAAVAIQSPRPQLEYQPIPPALVGEMYYYANPSAGDAFLGPLQEYLHRFNDLQVDPGPGKKDEREVVILLPFEISLSGEVPDGRAVQVLKLARTLSRRGYRILLVGRSGQSLGLIGGILFVGLETRGAIKKAIASLGKIDTLVSIVHADGTRAKATRNVVYELPTGEIDESASVQELVDLIQSAPIRKDSYQILADRPLRWMRKRLPWMRQRIISVLQRIAPLMGRRYK